jgi:renalase
MMRRDRKGRRKLKGQFMHIAIVGAGISGLACAELLRDAGHSVRLFDKGRGPGGRMATRRVATACGEASFDHGAQYFTARTDEFRAAVTAWEAAGVAAPWPIAGDDAWVGAGAMNGIVKAMAARLDVAFGVTVTGFDRSAGQWRVRHDQGFEGPFDALVVAIPAEQAAVLLSLHDFGMAQVALRARSQPCWTAMFAFAEPLEATHAPVRDIGIINWAVRNSAKPGRSGPESWVVQAQPEWSRQWLEASSEQVATDLLEHLCEALGVPLAQPLAAMAHRWRFAMSSGTGDEALWCEDKAIGACGDWLIAPRVESAWHSGRALAQRILGEA